MELSIRSDVRVEHRFTLTWERLVILPVPSSTPLFDEPERQTLLVSSPLAIETFIIVIYQRLTPLNDPFSVTCGCFKLSGYKWTECAGARSCPPSWLGFKVARLVLLCDVVAWNLYVRARVITFISSGLSLFSFA